MIETDEDIARHLQALLEADERLATVAAHAGPVPLRRGAAGLAGLCATVVAQQVSRASADAIFARLERAVDLADARAIAGASDETLRLVGLSRPKQRTIRAIAQAVCEGQLDLERVAEAEQEAAIAEMVAVHGVGRWTAECHLLFALGHEDVFPAGDLALQLAVAEAFGLSPRPRERELAAIALAWAPHRSVAARLFWAYYHALTRRDAAPAPQAVGKPSGDAPGVRTGFTKATR